MKLITFAAGKLIWTLVAVTVVLLSAASALAVNSVVVESKSVAIGATNVTIAVKLTNDITVRNIVVPLEMREITPGSFVTAVKKTYGGRLTGIFGSLRVANQYASPDGNCKTGQAGGYKTLTYDNDQTNFNPVAASPEGFLFAAGVIFPGDPTLAPGADVAGSLIFTVNVTSTPGSFEIDTTCTNPQNHLMFIQDGTLTPFVPAFMKAAIQIQNPPPSCGDMSFRPNPHGWQFSNSDGIDFSKTPYDMTNAIMWPKSWWQQFNYADPQYPLAWRLFCKSSDFPDWPLFVSAFGENQCYIDPPPGLIVYSPWAVAKWFSLKGAWGGSCSGFAISSLLFYDGYLQSSSEFPNNPPHPSLYDVKLEEQQYKPRSMINKYWLYWFGKVQQEHFEANWNRTTPVQTLDSCKAMFTRTQSPRDDQALYLANSHGDGAHEINPYRCEVDVAHPETTRVYVYDNNAPNIDRMWISINTNTNTWSYHGLRDKLGNSWTGSKNLFLMDRISDYYGQVPFLPSSIPPREKWPRTQANPALRSATPHVELYFPPGDTTVLSSQAGIIARVGDSLIQTCPEGHPIIPPTGLLTPPIGYYLPNAAWAIGLSGVSDSLQRFSLFTDSTVLVYSRELRDSIRNEQLRYLGDSRSLWVLNPDTIPRPYDIEAISTAPDSEIVFRVERIGIAHDDSALYSITPGSGLTVANHGPASTYDLSVEIASTARDTVFAHRGVIIESGSAHKILPDWRSHGDSLVILVDSGFTGTFKDTVRVANQGLCDCSRQGDINADGVMDVFDVIGVIGVAFTGAADPQDSHCPKARGDIDNNGVTDVFDVIYLIATAFGGGPGPVNPCAP